MRQLLFIGLSLTLVAVAPSKSLWTSKRNSERGMFADRTAASVGDILLIRIDEETIVNRSSSKSTSSNTNISYGISSFIIPDVLEDNSVMPNVALSPTDSFSGSGSVSDTNVLEAKIAVQVVDVLPNGNLLIEGARKVKMQGETQYVVMKGQVRGDDVMTDNSVMSYNIVNASVEVLGDGDLMTAQKKNWLNQLLDAVNIL